MPYYQYLYQLSVQAVLITDILSKNSILAADIIADPIIGTSLHTTLYHVIISTGAYFKGKILLGKMLANQLQFTKFVNILPLQYFATYDS